LPHYFELPFACNTHLGKGAAESQRTKTPSPSRNSSLALMLCKRRTQTLSMASRDVLKIDRTRNKTFDLEEGSGKRLFVATGFCSHGLNAREIQ